MNSTPKRIFVNQESKHNKFWTIKTRTMVGDPVVVTNHGRLGTKGKIYDKDFNSRTAAKLFVTSKVDEKKRKGYVEIKQEQLNELHIQSAIIGTQNKLEEFGWVEMIWSATYPNDSKAIAQQPKDMGTSSTTRSVMLKPVLDTRIAEPDYDPAIHVVVEMRSKHFKDKISIVLTADSIYQLTLAERERSVAHFSTTKNPCREIVLGHEGSPFALWVRSTYQAAQIDEQHELFDMCNKIKEAISHSL